MRFQAGLVASLFTYKELDPRPPPQSVQADILLFPTHLPFVEVFYFLDKRGSILNNRPVEGAADHSAEHRGIL